MVGGSKIEMKGRKTKWGKGRKGRGGRKRKGGGD